MEDINDADYLHAKAVCKVFRIKNLDEFLDLYVWSDTIVSADLRALEINVSKYMNWYSLHSYWTSISAASGIKEY